MKKTLLYLALVLLPATVLADSDKPTCNEEPTRQDCISVENSNTTQQKQTVNEKKPSHLIAKPVPASGQGTGSRGKGK